MKYMLMILILSTASGFGGRYKMPAIDHSEWGNKAACHAAGLEAKKNFYVKNKVEVRYFCLPSGLPE